LNQIIHQHYGGTLSMTTSTDGAEILLEAHNLITGDRHDEYAHPLEDYTQTRDIFEAVTGVHLTVEQAIMFMVSVKLSRLRTAQEAGRWSHDSLVDAAGYLGCFAMVREAQWNR
jgi:hypothetical protein